VGGGVPDGVGVGDTGGTDGVGVGVTGGTDGVGVGVGLGTPHGLTGQLKISVEARDPRFSSRPPASQMLLVPSVSVGKLRRALLNGIPSDQVSVPGS